MRRHGIIGDFTFNAIWGFALVILLAALIAFGISAADRAETEIRTFYTDNVVAEEVMGAPCATSSRGVFYRSSIITGDFACTAPVGGPLYVRFTLDDDSTHAWAIRGKDGPADITPYGRVDLLGDPFSQTYRVLVRDGGTTTPATMEVGTQ